MARLGALLALVLAPCLAPSASGSEAAEGAAADSQGPQIIGLSEIGHATPHHLRVCNAYPDVDALDIRGGRGELLTGSGGPLGYKTCRDFRTTLRKGDLLEFKAHSAAIGAFSVDGVPDADAVLLLVVQRLNSKTDSVSFDSHIFADYHRAQVAVIDAYRGTAEATPRIMDPSEGRESSRRVEQLQYNRVIKVLPGRYDVTLVGSEGTEVARTPLVAANRGSYVILRTGLDSQDKDGKSKPQDLVVFPQSSESELRKRSGAVRHGGAARLLALVVAVAAVVPFC